MKQVNRNKVFFLILLIVDSFHCFTFGGILQMKLLLNVMTCDLLFILQHHLFDSEHIYKLLGLIHTYSVYLLG